MEDVPARAGPAVLGSDRLRARTGGTALRLPRAGRRARALGRAALALDAGTVRGLLTGSIAAVGIQATWDDVARPVLTAVAQRAVPLMREGGALLTLSYIGSGRVTPNYNVMGVAKAALECSVRYLAADLGSAGIRVNCVCPGPVDTPIMDAILARAPDADAARGH